MFAKRKHKFVLNASRLRDRDRDRDASHGHGHGHGHVVRAKVSIALHHAIFSEQEEVLPLLCLLLCCATCKASRVARKKYVA